jgi:chromosome segregation ATPase
MGAVAAAIAYLKVGGLPGVLYAAGICLAAFVGTVAIIAGRSEESSEESHEKAPTTAAAAPRSTRWRRKSHVIAELEQELASTGAELEDHRRALSNLATQLSRESEAAHRTAQRLEQRMHELVAEERERFDQTLDQLGGGIGRHGNELAELERELEALITR